MYKIKIKNLGITQIVIAIAFFLYKICAEHSLFNNFMQIKKTKKTF